MITFNTWADVRAHFVKDVVPKWIDLTTFSESDVDRVYNAWCEYNYCLNPTFTVKEQESTDRSDAYDRATCHN